MTSSLTPHTALSHHCGACSATSNGIQGTERVPRQRRDYAASLAPMKEEAIGGDRNPEEEQDNTEDYLG
jgi:hypothetical protein